MAQLWACGRRLCWRRDWESRAVVDAIGVSVAFGWVLRTWLVGAAGSPWPRARLLFTERMGPPVKFRNPLGGPCERAVRTDWSRGTGSRMECGTGAVGVRVM
ncbi:hypothetical protein GCM10029964_037190 [Kibdelosporangium lantanae]